MIYLVMIIEMYQVFVTTVLVQKNENEEYILPLFLSEPFICHEKWEYNGLA